jgi:hypothetical protein
MRRLPVFLVLTLGAVNLYALTLPEKEKTPDKEAPPIRQENTTPGPDKRPVPPVKNYTPTEKIKADSAVSFPVDI